MKNNYFFLFSLALIATVLPASHTFGQIVKRKIGEPAQLRAVYRLTYLPDSANPATKTETMILLAGNSYSKFYSPNRQKADSLLSTLTGIPYPDTRNETQNLLNRISEVPKTRFGYKIYKYRNENKTTYIDLIGAKTYSNTTSIDPFHWRISKGGIQSIGGYACQKATTNFAGRIYEAWFTREIPISDGPYKFTGLPGLIIKVADVKQQYNFELISLKDIRKADVTIDSYEDKTSVAVATIGTIYEGQKQNLQRMINGALSSSTPNYQRAQELKSILATYKNRIELE